MRVVLQMDISNIQCGIACSMKDENIELKYLEYFNSEIYCNWAPWHAQRNHTHRKQDKSNFHSKTHKERKKGVKELQESYQNNNNKSVSATI